MNCQIAFILNMSATESDLMKKHHSGASVARNTGMWLQFAEGIANAGDVERKNAGNSNVKKRMYLPNAATVQGITLQEQHNVQKDLGRLK